MFMASSCKTNSINFEALDSLNIPIEWTHYGDGEEMGILQSKIKIIKIKIKNQISRKNFK